jgi:hypothetical protein
MTFLRRTPEQETGRQARTRDVVPDLTKTADASSGTSNPDTRPRAGNLSSDTRAGILG